MYLVNSLSIVLGPKIYPLTPCLCSISIVSMSDWVVASSFMRKNLLFSTPLLNSASSLQYFLSIFALLNTSKQSWMQ